MGEERGAEERSTSRVLYLRSLLDSCQSGLISPFLSYFAVDLGASDADLGWLSAVTNFTPNLMQVVWGSLSDRVGRRVPFIVLGGLWTAVLWLVILNAGSPSVLIILVGVQALVGSMTIPAWSAIQGDLIPLSLRGRLTSSIAFGAALGGIVATLITSLYFLLIPQGPLRATYLAPFLAASVLGIIASLSILSLRGKEHLKPVPTRRLLPRQILATLRQLPEFERFLFASTVYGFFMAIAWPLFIRTQVDLLGMSTFEVGLLSVANGFALVLFQRWAGTLLDRAGRRPVMLLHRFGLAIVPVTYGVAPFFIRSLGIFTLFAVNLLTGFLLAIGNLAVLVYLLDVVPEIYRGSLSALYNAVIGVAYFFGSLLGGYLASLFTTTLGVSSLALLTVYLISTGGRTVGAVTFLRVRETQKTESNMKQEVIRFLRRDRN